MKNDDWQGKVESLTFYPAHSASTWGRGLGSPYCLGAPESFRGVSGEIWWPQAGSERPPKGFPSDNSPCTQDLSISLLSSGSSSEQAYVNLPHAPLSAFIIPSLPVFWNSFPATCPACRMVMPTQLSPGRENQNWHFLRPGECPVLAKGFISSISLDSMNSTTRSDHGAAGEPGPKVIQSQTASQAFTTFPHHLPSQPFLWHFRALPPPGSSIPIPDLSQGALT